MLLRLAGARTGACPTAHAQIVSLIELHGAAVTSVTGSHSLHELQERSPDWDVKLTLHVVAVAVVENGHP